MLDFVFMDDGFSLADRDEYNAVASQTAARHGVVLQTTLDTAVMVIGPTELDRLDLWTLTTPDALAAWGRDADYLANKDRSDEIHDMRELTLYLGRQVQAPEIESGRFYYLELFAFNPESFTGEEFITYTRQSDTLAGQYAIFRRASFSQIGRILGNGPEVNWMNLYYISSDNNFRAWHNSAEFKSMVPTRQKLFDWDKSVLAIMKAK